MKTIKILLLVLLSTLFLGCSKNYDDDLFEEEVEEKVLKSKTYHFKQYYEKPVVINRSTTDDDVSGYSFSSLSGTIGLGYLAYQQKYINNQVIDTLTIDLNSYNKDIKTLSFNNKNPSELQNKYLTINYLNIIGLDDHPNLKIIGRLGVYGKVEVYNSNISIDKLNNISFTDYGQKINMFEKIDYERKEWEWTYVIGSSNYGYENLQDKPIGYVGYAQHNVRGIRIEIMNITENYN